MKSNQSDLEVCFSSQKNKLRIFCVYRISKRQKRNKLTKRILDCRASSRRCIIRKEQFKGYQMARKRKGKSIIREQWHSMDVISEQDRSKTGRCRVNPLVALHAVTPAKLFSTRSDSRFTANAVSSVSQDFHRTSLVRKTFLS